MRNRGAQVGFILFAFFLSAVGLFLCGYFVLIPREEGYLSELLTTACQNDRQYDDQTCRCVARQSDAHMKQGRLDHTVRRAMVWSYEEYNQQLVSGVVGRVNAACETRFRAQLMQ